MGRGCGGGRGCLEPVGGGPVVDDEVLKSLKNESVELPPGTGGVDMTIL